MKTKQPPFPILILICFVSLLTLGINLHGQKTAPKEPEPQYAESVPKPTLSEVRYGDHERHVLDFWKAKSSTPTPLVFVIHGGGWTGGSKERLDRFADTQALLDAGISVVSINYRLMKHSEGVVPPVKAPLHDAARALQFVRSKAREWNINKTRIGAAGGSAGACSSLWLAYHDDLADPSSKDLVCCGSWTSDQPRPEANGGMDTEQPLWRSCFR
jgi:acetyl esterase/lipase